MSVQWRFALDATTVYDDALPGCVLRKIARRAGFRTRVNNLSTTPVIKLEPQNNSVKYCRSQKTKMTTDSGIRPIGLLQHLRLVLRGV